MPSGKKSRQQRQSATPPPVRSTGPGGARNASTRTLAIIGGVILLVIIAVVLGIVLTQNGNSSNSSSPSADGPTIGIVPGTPAVGSATNPNASLNATDVESLFTGVKQSGMTLGDPNAPVTLVEYVDTQCPYCAEFETTALPDLVKKYVKQGKLKVELHVWNILDANVGGDDSLRGQKSVIGASHQNKAFNFISVLYWNQGTEGTGWFNDGMVSQLAGSVTGLNTSTFANDANSSSTAALIKATDAYALSQPGFTGTPVILLAKGTEKPKLYGTGWGTAPMDTASLEAEINKLLK